MKQEDGRGDSADAKHADSDLEMSIVSESDQSTMGSIEPDSPHHKVTDLDKMVDSSDQKDTDGIEVNYWYLTFYVVTLALNSIAVAWTTGGNNQTANVIAAKLEWSAADTRFYNTAINFASQIGKALGAMAGGKIIQASRKDAFMRYNALAILTTVLMQHLSVPMLVFAKFTNGFVVTVCHIAAIKMINESVPVAQLSRFGPVLQVFAGVGYLLVLGLGLGLPASDYSPSLPLESENLEAFKANQVDQFWRVLYAFPLLINGAMMIFFKLFIDADPIMYCLGQRDEEQACKLIERIYVLRDRQDLQLILAKLKQQVHMATPKDEPTSQEKESYFDCLFSKENMRGTLILMVFTSLNQMATINVLNIYSNRLMTIVNEDAHGFKVPANTATQLVGLTSCFSVLFALFLVPNFNRKQLLVVGQTAVAIMIFCLVLAIYMRISTLVVLCVLITYTLYQMTLGPVHWVYLPEVTSDAQFGFIATIHYLNSMAVSVLTEYMFEYLRPSGTFVVFGTLTALGVPFMKHFVEETEGLSEREKRQLYKRQEK